MKPRYALPALALAACSGSGPTAGPSASSGAGAGPAARGLQIRTLSADVPDADCPKPPPDVNPPADASAALPGLAGGCYRVNEAVLTLPRVADAQASESGGQVTIAITLPADLADDLAKTTEELRNRHATLSFDGEVLLSWPVTERITDGRIVIVGPFSRTEADDVARRLRDLR